MLAADDLAVAATPADRPATADAAPRRPRRARRITARTVFDATWPKLAAVAIFVFAVAVRRVERVEVRSTSCPARGGSPARCGTSPRAGSLRRAVGITFQRAIVGFAASIVIGVAIGLAVASSKIVRRAIGSMITGIQTMPSIAWFPLAIVLFQLDEGAIRFVVILGAAPAIANGLITGIDHVPPLLLRAGRVIGARGINAYRYVILPATLPSFVGGLKQGWAFAWRSLMAGELLVIIASKPSIGQQMQQARSLSRYSDMIAWMVVVFIIGLLVDAVAFGTLDRAIRRRWGLLND